MAMLLISVIRMEGQILEGFHRQSIEPSFQASGTGAGRLVQCRREARLFRGRGSTLAAPDLVELCDFRRAYS
jgi:hypothetical protein